MEEERLIRGLHPYIAQRMQLERLRKFDLTRLPSADEEIYLFQCVARENPADDRLVEALAAGRQALKDIGDKLAQGDLRAFETHGRFIETRYKDPEQLG